MSVSSAPAPARPAAPPAAFVGRAVAWVMVAAGALGLAAAFALTIEKFRLLEDPLYVPACSFDAVLTCTAVMNSDQAEAFGFPNPLLGIAGFAALTALGVALVAGARLGPWLWLAVQVGVTFAVVFVHWLFFQSVYRIEALCPFCMAVWVAAIVAFVYVTLHNVAAGRLLPKRLGGVGAVAVRYHTVIVIAWFAVLGVQILIAFWDHWRTVL